MQAYLGTGNSQTDSEVIAIENISNHGARIISRRHWAAHDHVVLVGFMESFRAEAEVVYCQRLGADQCAVGLRFRDAVIVESATIDARREV